VLLYRIVCDDSTWTKDGTTVEFTLAKGTSNRGDEEGHWWASALKGGKQLDVKKIEAGRYLDDSILKQIWEKEEAEAAAANEEKKDEAK